MNPPPRREPFWTLPNVLTLSRLPLGALVWLRPLDPIFVLSVMAVAGLTDVLDGWVERRRRARRGIPPSDPGTPETLGVWLDPLCDKIFVLSLLSAIAVARSIPVGLVILVALREILQALIALGSRAIPALRRRLRFRFRANVMGKVSTVAQFLATAALLERHPWQVPLAILTAVLGATAALIYLGRAVRAGRPTPPTPP
ncbi:MAG TPA: CDP-alcohol phosphatidyltransferase family protein [Planctomycetota bacterium]|nr:CDP-alcohol phosphatidyltransferase family protein [Planctomycetota bacterium]